MKNKLFLTCVAAILGTFGAQAAPKFQNVHLIAGNEAIGGKVTLIKNSQRWTADTVYIIDRLTFVEAPAVLTIEPGTIVRLEQKTTGGTSVTDPADVGTLIICRGAKIVANGTAESPIIFTNIDDPFVPGGEITIPNYDNGVTNNAAYAPWSAGSFTKRDYSGNNRFNHDATCGGLIVLGKTPVAFGNPGANGGLIVSLTEGGSGYTLTPPTVTVSGGKSSLSIAASDVQVVMNPTGVDSVTVTSGGIFTNVPTATFASSPDRATCTVQYNRLADLPGGDNQLGNADDVPQYTITEITVTKPGDGYYANAGATGGPTLTFSPVTTNSPVVTVNLQTTSVAQVTLKQPGVYTEAPTIEIAAPALGTRATASVVVGSSFQNPKSAPITTGIGANFIEGFQTIDGALLGTNNVVGGTTYNFSGSIYGGSNDDDNSGTIRFASIRYGGFVLSPNNEINGLTCGAVGRGTSFEFIEVVNNADDDIEHFGGSVDMKYVACLFGGDDGIDLDQGYRGRIQFAFQIQNNTSGTSRNTLNAGDALCEWDGPENPTSGRPYTIPTLFNYTGIGRGTGTGGAGLDFRDNSGGKIFNSIWADNPKGANLRDSSGVNDGGEGTTVGNRFASTRNSGGNENLLGDTNAAIEPDAFIKYTSYRKINTATTTNQALSGLNSSQAWALRLVSSNFNDFAHNLSDFRGVARVNTSGGLDPRLTTNSTIRSNGILPSASGGVRATDPWYTQTTLRGAFRDLNWLSGWSLLTEWGLLSDANTLIPAVRLTRTSGALFVGFNTVAGVEYSIETSTDGKMYTPVRTIVGTGSAANESLGANTANALTFVRVMPL